MPKSSSSIKSNQSLDDRGLAIEYRRCSVLQFADRNPRTHSKKQLRQIARSIEAFGFTNPLLIDERDIDAVLDYYSDNIVYEHPRFGIRLEGKEAQRQGMVAFLSSYAGGPSDSSIEILDFMKGDGVVTVRLAVSFLQERKETVERISREQFRVLEFSSGKISRIIDYW